MLKKYTLTATTGCQPRGLLRSFFLKKALAGGTGRKITFSIKPLADREVFGYFFYTKKVTSQIAKLFYTKKRCHTLHSLSVDMLIQRPELSVEL